MGETLIIEKLGPIKKLEIKPRPLTIIIGEQASGKSLVAQLLYFFRGLESHLASIYNDELTRPKNWHALAVKRLLDDLRGVDFGYFASGTAKLHYRDSFKDFDWKVNVRARDLSAAPLKGMIDDMTRWVDLWAKDKEALGEVEDRQVFIPTERSLVTRFLYNQQAVLYAPYQPLPFRQFAVFLARALARRQRVGVPEEDLLGRKLDLLSECEKRALAGCAVFSEPERIWQWRVVEAGTEKLLPITATSSGQMEAWPFFVIASRIAPLAGVYPSFVYFEEPETHLHPSAQVEVMKAIVYLVNRGHQLVVTTHSPYLLYVVNNMLQRFISFKGEIPEQEHRWLNPEKVAAYRLRQQPDGLSEEIMDRTETNLIDAQELEKVANDLGAEFDKLLYDVE